MEKIELKRGDVILVNLDGATGYEKQKTRPCIVVQNDKGNAASPLTIVVPLTDANQYKGLPVQVEIPSGELGVSSKDSVAECGHVRTIDRTARVQKKLAHLGSEVMARVDAALRVSLGLSSIEALTSTVHAVSGATPK